MDEKVVVIVNPMAKKGAAKSHFLKAVPKLHELFGNAEIHYTKAPMHATGLARESIRKGATLIIAVGGDGTINEVVNGFFKPNHELENPNAKMAVLANGTGGDFRKTLGLSAHMDENLERIRHGKTTHVDVGLATSHFADGTKSRFFLNVASCGLSAEVVKLSKESDLRIAGFLQYYLSTMRALWRHKTKNIDLTNQGNKITIKDCSLLAFANGRFFGGGMQIAPNASIQDGLLDQISVTRMNLLFFLKHGPKVYSGKHINLPSVRTERVKDVMVQKPSESSLYIEVDGELFGEAPVRFQILPGALPLVS